MSGILIPVLWIDAKATKLLKAILAGNGNTYFAPSKQANTYGITVTEVDLPNGLDSQFSIGTADDKGVTVPTSPVDKEPNKVSGEITLPIGGKKMTVSVMVHALKDAAGEHVVNDDGLKLYTLKPVVRNVATRRTYTSSEIYV